jgi:hypothetical protein
MPLNDKDKARMQELKENRSRNQAENDELANLEKKASQSA